MHQGGGDIETKLDARETEKRHTLLVEFIGQAGTGKTTLCAATREALVGRATLHVVTASRHGAGFPDPSPRPGLCAAASRLADMMPNRYDGKYDHAYWLARLRRVDGFYRQAPEASAHTLVLSDQGVLQFLRKAPQPLPEDLLALLPLPDVVIEVRAPFRDVHARRSERQKAGVDKSGPYVGEQRQRAVTKIARRSIEEAEHGELLGFLLEWNCCHCEPPLCEEEVSELVTEAVRRGVKDNPRTARMTVLRASLESMGRRWLIVDNPDGQPVSTAVDQVVEFVLAEIRGRRD